MTKQLFHGNNAIFNATSRLWQVDLRPLFQPQPFQKHQQERTKQCSTLLTSALFHRQLFCGQCWVDPGCDCVFLWFQWSAFMHIPQDIKWLQSGCNFSCLYSTSPTPTPQCHCLWTFPMRAQFPLIFTTPRSEWKTPFSPSEWEVQELTGIMLGMYFHLCNEWTSLSQSVVMRINKTWIRSIH